MPAESLVDIIIFALFLIITLAVGLNYGRQVKTIRGYALGGKNFSTATLTATILATYFGGGSFYYTLANTYSQGISFFISFLGAPLCLLITGQIIAPRMGSFLENVSVAEAMGDMYGKTVRTISAISGIAGQVGYVAIQFQVITRVLGLLWDTQDQSLTIVAATIVILYSTMGGISAVTFTDVLQFATFGTFIPILTITIWHNLQDHQQVADILTHDPKFQLSSVVGWNTKFASTIMLMLYYTMQGVTPPIFQRISMARDKDQAKNAFTYASLIALLIVACITWVAVLLLADNPNLKPNMLVNYLIEQYTYTGFKGLLVIGILALTMSTADSYINSCAVLFANDLAAPLGIGAADSAIFTRFSAFLVGTLALLLTLYEDDLLALLLLSGSFYLPIVSMPLLLAIFGFRSSSRAVLISMSAGFSSVILWRTFLAHTGVDSVIPSTFISLFAFLTSHYLLGEPGGWQQVDPESPEGIERAMRQEAWQDRKKAIRNFSLTAYLRQNLPAKESAYLFFGFYTVLSTYIAFFTISKAEAQVYQGLYQGIYYVVFLVTTSIFTFSLWPARLKQSGLMTFLWPLSMALILFFASTLLLLISHFNTVQAMILAVNFVMAVLLLQWPLALFLSLGGIGTGILLFQQYTGESLLWSELGPLHLRLIYGALLLTSLLLVLFSQKSAYRLLGQENRALTYRTQANQADILKVTAQQQDTLLALKNANIEGLLDITKELQRLPAKGHVAYRLQAIQAKLIPMVFQLKNAGSNAQSHLRLHTAPFATEALGGVIKTTMEQQGLQRVVHYKNVSQHRELIGDEAQLADILVKSIELLSQLPQATQGSRAHSILVKVEDTHLHYPLPDVELSYIKHTPAVRITVTKGGSPPPVAPYYQPDLTDGISNMPENIQHVTQLVNNRIIKAHYGHTEVKEATVSYVIPVHLGKLRPKEMDKPYMEPTATPQRANDHFINHTVDAQAQEEKFLASVGALGKINLGHIEVALELIKWYHGPKRRNTEEPFYLHPLAVAQIVLDYSVEEATIMGALLHDVVEDTQMLVAHIKQVFGPKTAQVVDMVTHLQHIQGSSYKIKLSPQESLEMLERTGNIPGLHVKIADRMHNIRTIEGHTQLFKRQVIAQETLAFFVPKAEKLGLYAAAQELKERCSKVLK